MSISSHAFATTLSGFLPAAAAFIAAACAFFGGAAGAFAAYGLAAAAIRPAALLLLVLIVVSALIRDSVSISRHNDNPLQVNLNAYRSREDSKRE